MALPLDPDLRLRLRSLLGLLFLTGCRISEALSCRAGDVNADGFVVLANLKQRERESKALPLEAPFLDELQKLGPAITDGQFFPWARARATALVSGALLAAGVERKRAHPHSLRHGCAVHMLRNGATLDVVQRQLGHSSIVTTAKYLRAVAEDLRRARAGMDWAV